MSSNSSLPLVLFLFLNLLFFGLSNCDTTPPKHKHHSHKSSSSPISPPQLPPLPSSPPFAFPLPRVSPPSTFPKSRKSGTCPRDAIRFGACAKVLGGLIGGQVGSPPKKPCCRLFGGLVEAEAAVCLCTAIKANVFGFNLNVPVSIGLVLNACDMITPPEDEEKSGLAIDGSEVNENDHVFAGFNAKLCVVARFITDGHADFQALQQTLAALWKPGRGVYIKELETNLYLFQFFHELDVKRVLDGSPWSFNRRALPMARLKEGENPR
ncbi:hypothetical protein AgCh_002828 [Apium graveolens]